MMPIFYPKSDVMSTKRPRRDFFCLVKAPAELVCLFLRSQADVQEPAQAFELLFALLVWVE